MDVRGVAIPPREYILGFVKRFDQAVFKEPDAVVFSLHKFMDLAAKANPNILEILYTDPEDHLVVTILGELLIGGRDLFLSKKARYSFVGYAMSQLKRIKTHRKWLLNPPKNQPKRTDFGLPEQSALPKEQMGAIEAMVRGKLDAWDVDWEVLEPVDRIAFRGQFEQTLAEMSLGTEEQQFASAARNLGLNENFGNATGTRSVLPWKRSTASTRNMLCTWFGYAVWGGRY
jgi:predicted nucleotidyltransferase